jgi:hypothetical protein
VAFAALDTGGFVVGNNFRFCERRRVNSGTITHFDGRGAGVAELLNLRQKNWSDVEVDDDCEADCGIHEVLQPAPQCAGATRNSDGVDHNVIWTKAQRLCDHVCKRSSEGSASLARHVRRGDVDICHH